MRIVSLLPSATELVCALGLGDSLVGISHDCDYPPEILDRPVLSEAIVTTNLPSGAIEARIRGQVHAGRSVYHLDAAQLAALRPDLILTQELCAVCAPSYTLVRQAARVLDAPTRLISLEPHGLTDIFENVHVVGEAGGVMDRAAALTGDLRRRIDAVRARVAGRPRPRVVCLEWLDPLYIGGHWVPEMVDAAGGLDVLGRPRQRSFVVDWDTVVAARPEVIVLMLCGFDLARARREVHLLQARPGWSALAPVQRRQVYLTDGSAYFSRPGPRIADGVEILAAILQKDRGGSSPPTAPKRYEAGSDERVVVVTR